MRVPVLEGQQVESRPMPTPYTQTDTRGAFDEDMTHAFEEAQHASEKIYARYQEAKGKADMVAVNDQLTTYQHDNTSDLDGNAEQNDPASVGTGDPNLNPMLKADRAFSGEDQVPQGGFLSTRGKDAAAKSVGTLKHLEDRRRELAEQLANDEQKQLFLEHSGKMYEASRARVEAHVSQQLEVAQLASAKARAETAALDIANNYDNPKYVEQTVKETEAALRAVQLSPEDGAAKVAAFRNQVGKALVGEYIADKNWRGARAQLEAVKAWLGPDARPFERTITQLEKDQQGEEVAANLVAEATDKQSGYVDAGKVLAGIDQVEAGPLRDEVRQRAEQRLQVASRQWNVTVSKVYDHALSAYLQGGYVAIPTSDKAWLLDPSHPGGPEKWRELVQMQKADAAHHRGEPPTPEQKRALTQFMVDLRDHPDKYAVMTEPEFNATWIGKLAPSDREQAGLAFASAHGAVSKPEKLNDTENRMLLQMGRDAGVFPAKQNDVSKWDENEAQLFYAANQQLLELATEYRRANGKAPPLDVVQKWAGDMLLKGRDPERGFLGFGGKTTLLEAEVKKTGFEPIIDSIPQGERAQIEEALRSRGREVTDEDVLRLWKLQHGFKAAPPQAKPPPAPAKAEPTPIAAGTEAIPGTYEYGGAKP